MVVLLAIVVLGAWWGLADGLTSDDDDAPRAPQFISAPAPHFGGPADVWWVPGGSTAHGAGAPQVSS